MWPADMIIFYLLFSLSIEKSSEGVVFDIQTIEIGHPDHTAWQFCKTIVRAYEFLES